MVKTSDFPQADRLEQVGEVAIAISKGHDADKKIEAYIGLASDGRQGRYYRQAAKALGLILNARNQATLTPLGKEFAALNTAAARKDFLAHCLIESPVFQEALRYINKYNPNDEQLMRWFLSFYPGSTNTADRRFNSLINYLRDTGLRQPSNDNLSKYIGSILKQSLPPASGLTGRKLKQFPPGQPVSNAKDVIHVDVDAQKLERANHIHWKLVAAKSTFLINRGYQPYDNEHIDLFTNVNGEVILYEMKSVNIESSNLLAQVRKAVSQLYEYRFIFNQPKAKLCIVTNTEISRKDAWLASYLSKDRAIAYAWTEDFKDFQCDEPSSLLLRGFSP